MTPTYVTTGQVLVRIQGLHKAYDQHVVLDGVELEIRDLRRTDESNIKQAQVVTLLGPSGIGKTTLIEAMAGLQSVGKGTILIDNPETISIEGMTTQDLIPTARGKVGVVYQDYRMFEFWTVEEHLHEALKTIGMKNKVEVKRKVEEFLSFFRLDEHKDKLPSQLSGGQKQRVSIAQQLLRSSQLLIMDEPFSGLDPETKGSVIDMINSVSKLKEELTIIIISHDIASALKVSDTVYVMGRNRDEKGVIRAGASILHEYTKDLKAMGLAWNDGKMNVSAELLKLELEINKMFPYLSGKI